MPVRGFVRPGLHRTKAKGVAAAARGFFDGETAFEVLQFLPLFGLHFFGGDKGIEEAVVLSFGEGAVDVVGGAFVPARGEVDLLHVDRGSVDDGRDGVIEGEVLRAGEALEFGSERRGCERAGG